jgi:hypothetical protein
MTSGFDEVVGYSLLGDVFLRSSKSGQIAVLFTIDPELVPLDFYDLESFSKGYLEHPFVQENVLKVDRVSDIEKKVGTLDRDQVYIAEPYLFLGGDESVESFTKGDLWNYLELVGAFQDIGPEAVAAVKRPPRSR